MCDWYDQITHSLSKAIIVAPYLIMAMTSNKTKIGDMCVKEGLHYYSFKNYGGYQCVIKGKAPLLRFVC